MGDVTTIKDHERFTFESCLERLNIAYVEFASAEELEAFTFQTRDGLFVEKSLSRLLGKEVSSKDKGTWVCGDRLLYTTANSRIVRCLPPPHVFTGEKGKQVLKQLLASFLIRQWSGEVGPLIEDGTENVFYFQKSENGTKYALEIFREKSRNDWYMSAIEIEGPELLDCEWQEGAFIFSAHEPLK